jgi:predicted dehydrogenase
MKAALIGCGYWGPNYIRVISETPGCSVAWCCDLDEKSLRSPAIEARGIRTSTDFNEMLKDESVDAVIVSTPTKSHYAIAKACLEAGKHALIEKPLAASSEEALKLKRLAESKQLVLMVGHIFEFNSGINKVKEYVEGKDIGDVLYVHLSRTGLGPIRGDVSALWDLATHDISILMYVLGKRPVSVTASGASYLQKGLEDVVFLSLKFEGNVMANVHVSWLDPYKIRKMTVVGDKKMVVFDDTSNEVIRLFDRGAGPVEGVSFADFKTQVWDGDVVIPKVPFTEPLREEFSYFMKCIELGRIEKSGAEDGYNVVKILEAAQESIKSGKTIPINW